jgi:signal transduction histidine kinase
MRERVRALGGSFEFASSKAGTAVEVAVPLPVTATEADA